MSGMKVSQAVKAARGHWAQILPALGVNILKNRHQPCPVCGGKDRFRFDDQEGRGTLMNPLMILVKIIKLRWIHILSYDQM
ncbi:primase-helicase zinc-binding domain-containing protein, partial [Escherichia coli]